MSDAVNDVAFFIGFWVLMLIPFAASRWVKRRLVVVRWPLRIVLTILIASILPSFIMGPILIAPGGDAFGLISAGAAVVILFVIGLIGSSVAFAITDE